jgi:hypothetical protein
MARGRMATHGKHAWVSSSAVPNGVESRLCGIGTLPLPRIIRLLFVGLSTSCFDDDC